MPDECLPKYLTPKHGSRYFGYQHKYWTTTVKEDFDNFTEYNYLNSTEIQQLATDRKLLRRIVRKCSAVDNDSAGSSQSEET